MTIHPFMAIRDGQFQFGMRKIEAANYRAAAVGLKEG